MIARILPAISSRACADEIGSCEPSGRRFSEVIRRLAPWCASIARCPLKQTKPGVDS
jgi:hypothetical protein